MDFTCDNPTRALKDALLHLIEHGCADSGLAAQFTSATGELPWQFIDEDAWEEIIPPCWLVATDGEVTTVSDSAPEGFMVPLEIVLYAPQTSTEEWLRSATDEMTRLLSGTYHAREVREPIDRTPLAWRLTSAAQALDTPVNLYVAYTTMGHPQKFGTLGTLGTVVEVRQTLTVCCGIYE